MPSPLAVPRFRLLTLAASSLSVQSMGTGTITGIVSDPSGAPVPKTTVTATDFNTRTPHTTTTTDTGNYSFTSLPIGLYQVSAELSGFKNSGSAGYPSRRGQLASRRAELCALVGNFSTCLITRTFWRSAPLRFTNVRQCDWCA